MNNKKWLVACLMSLVLILAACGGDGEKESASDGPLKGEFITILTGGSSGIYFPLGGTLSKIYSDLGARANSQSTSASAANLTTLNQGKAEVAFTMGDTAADAYEGIDSFEEQGKQENIRTIASLYTNYFQIVALEGSGIETVADLKGHSVAVGAPASGTEIAAQRVLEAYGMSYDDIKPDFLSFSEGVEGMKNGNVDAVVMSSGLPNAGILELATSKKVKIVAIEEDKVLEMQNDYPTFFPTFVPKETYKGMTEDVPTLGVNNYLMTHDGVSEDVVYEMTKAFYENIEAIQDSHNAAKDISIDRALESLPAPLHPGAKKYFDEQGISE